MHLLHAEGLPEATNNPKKTKEEKSTDDKYGHDNSTSSTFTFPPPPLPTYFNFFYFWVSVMLSVNPC